MTDAFSVTKVEISHGEKDHRFRTESLVPLSEVAAKIVQKILHRHGIDAQNVQDFQSNFDTFLSRHVSTWQCKKRGK